MGGKWVVEEVVFWVELVWGEIGWKMVGYDWGVVGGVFCY